MKKIVFSLGAVTAVCACGLVIDPDELVDGEASSPVSEAGGGSDVGTTPTAEASIDASDAASDGPSFVEIPECVPAAPAGTQGPYAVTVGSPQVKPACPSGYLAAPVTTARNNLAAETVTCGSTAGCGCSTPSGTATCGLRLRYFTDSQCANAVDSDALGGSCVDMKTEAYLKVEVTVTGVTCTNTGAATVAPTVKPTPAFREEWFVCAPDPNVTLAQCKTDQAALPPAKNAGACVITTAPACPAPYTQSTQLSKNGSFTDNRACACSCGGASSLCTGGSASIFSEDTCVDSPASFALETCLPRGGDDGMRGVLPSPSGGNAACAAKVTPTGTFVANDDLHLCCLP